MNMKSKDAQKFTEYYKLKDVTQNYDKQREATEYRRRKRALELKYFLDLIDKQEKDKVLEIGCSSGFLTKYLGKVTAIDTSKHMLKIAKRRNPAAKVILADMFNMPFKKDTYDKVVTMRVWNHLNREDLIKAIREAKRVLKRNGWLIFDAEDRSLLRKFIGFFYQRIFRVRGYKIYQYSLREIREILEMEGFVIDRTKILRHRVGQQIIIRAKLQNE